MRRILVGLGAAVCSVSLAAAQSTTTTIATSTSTTASSSSTTSTATTTSTPPSTACGNTGGGSYDPRACAQCGKSEGGSKEDCREDCCTGDFDLLAESCNAFEDCDDAEWTDFVEQWKAASEFYKTCQRDGGNASRFTEFNVPDSCREYVAGCKSTALRHVRQCADAERCVTCCRTVLRRWRQKIATVVRRKSENPRRCQQAIRCLRRASRKAEACRDACRRTPTCGEGKLKLCLESKQGGREILECYGKCADKCRNPDAYPWCIQACQGLNQCNAFNNCTDESSPEPDGRCLSRDERTCVTVTTSSTSTSTSTSSTVTTTSTSSSTVFLSGAARR